MVKQLDDSRNHNMMLSKGDIQMQYNEVLSDKINLQVQIEAMNLKIEHLYEEIDNFK